MKIDSGRILPGKALLKPVEEEKTTRGGIIIPTEVMKPKMFSGEVVLINNDPSKPETVHLGDKVLHSPHAFVNVTIDNVDYRLISIQDVLFIWRD